MNQDFPDKFDKLAGDITRIKSTINETDEKLSAPSTQVPVVKEDNKAISVTLASNIPLMQRQNTDIG